jgi:hypothetical protein
MHPAQAKITGCKPPENSVLLGYIDNHPAGRSALGFAVLLFPATGIEVAWDGTSSRTLPRNWRDKAVFTPVSAAAALGRLGGLATSEEKAAAARANGKRGGRPRKHRPVRKGD